MLIALSQKPKSSQSGDVEQEEEEDDDPVLVVHPNFVSDVY